MGAGGAIGFLSPAAKRSTLAVFFLGFSLGLSLSVADSLDSIGNSHSSNSVGSHGNENCWLSKRSILPERLFQFQTEASSGEFK